MCKSPVSTRSAGKLCEERLLHFETRSTPTGPESEVKSLGNELYQILIGPVAKNIESYQPKTLVWSLDDVLRYVPMAALYDGSHYLTESYANVVINLASLINLKDKPSSDWTSIGTWRFQSASKLARAAVRSGGTERHHPGRRRRRDHWNTAGSDYVG